MSRMFRGPVLLAAGLAMAAAYAAWNTGKLTQLLIGAASTAAVTVALSMVLERRVFDAYEEGKRQCTCAASRELEELQQQRRG